MTIPGFTAESSVYKTRMHYRLGVGAPSASHPHSHDSHISDVFVTPAGVCTPSKRCHNPCCVYGAWSECCDPDAVCKDSDGNCTQCCRPPKKCCAGTCNGNNPSSQCCTSVSTDPENCGDCGNQCQQGQNCVNGQCCYPQELIIVLALLLCWGIGCQSIYEQLLQEYPVCPA